MKYYQIHGKLRSYILPVGNYITEHWVVATYKFIVDAQLHLQRLNQLQSAKDKDIGMFDPQLKNTNFSFKSNEDFQNLSYSIEKIDVFTTYGEFLGA